MKLRLLSISYSILLLKLFSFAALPAELKHEHLRYGAPGYQQEDSGKQLIIREGYALLFDFKKKGPLWVVYKMTDQHIEKKVTRAKAYAFQPDPLILKSNQAALTDYKGSGWDRGHMAPSLDMRRSNQVQIESFYLSNIVPQNPALNRGLWAKLEQLGNNYAKKYKDLQIFTGPIYEKKTSQPTIKKTIGESKVHVPQWLYKIFVRKSKSGKLKVLAFEVPNGQQNQKNDLTTYLVPLAAIDRDTGLKFLNIIPESQLKILKNHRPPKLWSITEKWTKLFKLPRLLGKKILFS